MQLFFSVVKWLILMKRKKLNKKCYQIVGSLIQMSSFSKTVGFLIFFEVKAAN